MDLPPAHQTPRSQSSRPGTGSSFLRDLAEDETRHLQDAQAVVPNINDQQLLPPELWMERTGWASLYGATVRPLLAASVMVPNHHTCRDGLLIGQLAGQRLYMSAEEEQQLRFLTMKLDPMFRRCEQTVQQTSPFILRWLRSNLMHRPYRVPFQLVGSRGSAQRYVRVWKQILSVVVRITILQRRYSGSMLRELQFPLSESLATMTNELWRLSSSTKPREVRTDVLDNEDKANDAYDDEKDEIDEDSDYDEDDTDHEDESDHEEEKDDFGCGDAEDTVIEAAYTTMGLLQEFPAPNLPPEAKWTSLV